MSFLLLPNQKKAPVGCFIYMVCQITVKAFSSIKGELPELLKRTSNRTTIPLFRSINIQCHKIADCRNYS